MEYGGDAVETQVQIPGDQFENTDYMQKQLQWMADMESKIQKALVFGINILGSPVIFPKVVLTYVKLCRDDIKNWSEWFSTP